jgi:hypothetical protein
MTYELAKELKDVGFPQKDHVLSEDDGKGWPMDVPPYQWPYVPTLEELIEACGDTEDRFHLFSAADNNHQPWEAQWRLSDTFAGSHNWMTGSGSTPTEAVARLYIALKRHA